MTSTDAQANKLLLENEKLSLEIAHLSKPLWRSKEFFGVFATVGTLVGIAVNIALTQQNSYEALQRQQARNLIAALASSNASQRESAGLLLSNLDQRYNFDELKNAYDRALASAASSGSQSQESPYLRVGLVEALAAEPSGWGDSLPDRLRLIRRALDDASPLVRAKAIEGLVRLGEHQDSPVVTAYLADVAALLGRERQSLEGQVAVREEYGGQVLVLPAGLAVVGSDRDEKYEMPARVERYASFTIDRYPVTNAQWNQYMRSAPALERESPAAQQRRKWRLDPANAQLPLTGATYLQAKEYCRRTGQRSLPTEIQWEVAARGTSGWPYPWGVDRKPSHEVLENERRERLKEDRFTVLRLSSGHPADASPFGVMNAVTSVRQWTVSEWRDSYKFEGNRTEAAPCTRVCVVRGSAGMDAEIYDTFDRFRASRRTRVPAKDYDDNLGFRCAGSAVR